MAVRGREQEFALVSGIAAAVIVVVLGIELALGCDCGFGCDVGRSVDCDDVGRGTGTGAVAVVRRRSCPFRHLNPAFQN